MSRKESGRLRSQQRKALSLLRATLHPKGLGEQEESYAQTTVAFWRDWRLSRQCVYIFLVMP